MDLVSSQFDAYEFHLQVTKKRYLYKHLCCVQSNPRPLVTYCYCASLDFLPVVLGSGFKNFYRVNALPYAQLTLAPKAPTVIV